MITHGVISLPTMSLLYPIIPPFLLRKSFSTPLLPRASRGRGGVPGHSLSTHRSPLRGFLGRQNIHV